MDCWRDEERFQIGCCSRAGIIQLVNTVEQRLNDGTIILFCSDVREPSLPSESATKLYPLSPILTQSSPPFSIGR